ncbi:MAG TPA: COR domain-containing protein, partial [Chthoniobacteraceae bacterium]|nr:COR domain-containing protein [Chthoniobacteraceae bacterium]
PAQFGQLIALTQLYLFNNRLTAVPTQLGDLTSLRELRLQNNQLTSLPPQIGRLSTLTLLYLHTNQLAAVPAEFGKLRALEHLLLMSNKLTSLPTELRQLQKLKRLCLHDNPALDLSPSVLGADPRKTQDGFASPQAIMDFYFSRRTEATRPLNEVKMILVGRGGAGKTSTVQALRGEPFHEGEDSTPGIALCDWKLVGCQGDPVTAHVWDFAGQVITHALHQFFFSERSVYVLVLTGRENSEREDAEYWLKLIYAFGKDEKGEGPPVIVVLNKWDVPGCRPRVDRGALRERYTFIRGFVETDCKTKKGIDDLEKALCSEVDQLPWVREPFPATWDAVRRALARGADKRPHLPYTDYRLLCAAHDVTEERLQDSLSDVLHNLGAALNYRNDPRLREATVLQPEWLTNHVYALMRHAETQEGMIRHADLHKVLSDEPNPAVHAYLIHLMERFEIAYAPRTGAVGLWLVPQALPDEQPEGAAAFATKSGATRLRYTYPALPEGLVARAIVRLHEFIEETDGKKQLWASGAILTREGARALLRKEPQDRVVMITVTGLDRRTRQQLAGLCRAEMRDIHREIPGLDPTEETQVQTAWVETATLELDEEKGRMTGVSKKGVGTVVIDPARANDAYSEKPARTVEVWKPTVFISYSKNNVTQRKRLESELKILKNAGLLAGHWQDRMIDPGDKWDAKIQGELGGADVVIILVSSAALSTDYITEHEIPKALAREKAGEAVVVPLILEECRWDLTALTDLNAVPDKGKALNKWTRQADAWKTVSEGLERVFRRLMEEGKDRR